MMMRLMLCCHGLNVLRTGFNVSICDIMRLIILFLLFFSIVSHGCTTEKQSFRIVVEAGDFDRENTLTSVVIDMPDITSDSPIVLYETTGGEERVVACQLDRDDSGSLRLYWILEGKTFRGESRSFRLEMGSKNTCSPSMIVDEKKGAYIITDKTSPILQYNYATVYPPKGVDPAFRRSGFIHPVWSPSGNILTNIQPKDHYHHYGIWNPWTRVEFDGVVYDLWNLGDKQGTVAYAETDEIVSGAVWSGFTVKHKHLIFKGVDSLSIMDESWRIAAWKIADKSRDFFVWDFTSELTPCTGRSILLKAYRYAGFGYRATDVWTKENCIMVTSEGKERPEIDGTNARWIYITGSCENGMSGLLFMGYPQNQNFPEPLRIWDQNANNGRGDAFINFAPTKNSDWLLEAGNSYKLKYRVVVYDGEMSSEMAESFWRDFAYPPSVTIQ